MSKKILSVVLALAMVLSIFAIPTFAVGGNGFEELDENGISTYTQTWALGEPVDNGDGTWSVDVSLTANYVVGAIQFQISNTNKDGAVLTDFIENADVFTDDYGAMVSVGTATNSGIVSIVPSPAADGSTGIDLSEGAVIGTLVYTVADGVTADIAIINDAKSATNPGGNLIAVRLDNGNLTTATNITGQTVLSVGEARTIGAIAAEEYTVSFDANGGTGSMADVTVVAGDYTLPENSFVAATGYEFAAWEVNGTQYNPGDVIPVSADTTVKAIWAQLPADLAKKSTAEAGIIIDTVHTFSGAYKGVVFGFTQAATNTFMNTTYLNNAFEATNGGSLAFSRSIGKTGYGTGTVITVKNADGTEAAKYVVVIFGDVDGNGLINANDTNLVRNVVAKTQTLEANSVQTMSANCQNVVAAVMMHTINANDTNVVRNHVGGTKIDQAALATRMSTLTTTNYK